MNKQRGLTQSKIKTPNRVSKGIPTGFTLIELLLVIAIIALLMSVLMPALNKINEQARSVICQSNLRQYGIAERMYMDDNDGWFTHPWYWYVKEGTSFPTMWELTAEEPDGQLWPYLKLKRVHMCPTFKRVGKYRMKEHDLYEEGMIWDPQLAYGKNHLIGWPPDSTDLGARRESDFRKKPAQIYLFTEENMWLINMARGDDYNLSAIAHNDGNLIILACPGYQDCFGTYHNPPGGNLNKGSANLVFADGHADKCRMLEQLYCGSARAAHPQMSIVCGCDPPEDWPYSWPD